jgi:hypothetical protein
MGNRTRAPPRLINLVMEYFLLLLIADKQLRAADPA